jgi:glycosyltransferase involved in cell wall biosynthesis
MSIGSRLDAWELPTICHVLHSLNVGGTETLATNLTRALCHRYRFVFACLDDLGAFGRQLREEGHVVTVLNRRQGGVDFSCARRLSAFFQRERVRVVHAHHYSPFFYATAARGLNVRPSVLYAEHGPSASGRSPARRTLYNRLALRTTDRLVAVGQAMRDAMVRNDGFPFETVKVIYNGVDTTVFTTTQCNRTATRSALGAAAGQFVVIHVARLDPVKDHLTALKAIERVIHTRSDVRLLLVGEGSERARIESEIASRRLAAQVQLLGLRDDVSNLLCSADLFLLTSLNETAPVAAIEAMCAGLPVVATRVGGVPEVVLDGVTGFLTPPGDSEALADAILRLIAIPRLASEMGRLGRQRAEQLFSHTQMSWQYQGCYDDMLRHHGSIDRPS